ncbi:hypothetical protein IFM89_008066 [Coptis chinensis]|uniref:Uncharacterized protein n=1 Tax=Coptis chinensis TaxID=261450 RepID=A0A835M920_9MAGN|nr:hypothetical protein IFM89_008066 [Coptis chinensis]
MDSQFYQTAPSYENYQYYPPPHQPLHHHHHAIYQTPNSSSTLLAPPGIDPSYTTPLNSYYTNAHVGFEAQPTFSYDTYQSSQVGTLPTSNYYQDPSISSSWVAKEAVQHYGALPEPGYSTAINSLNSNQIPNQILPTNPNNLAYDATQTIPKNTKVSESVRCEICKIECTSKDAHDKHLYGKKHKRNLLLQDPMSELSISHATASLPKDKKRTKKRSSSSVTGNPLGKRAMIASSVFAAGQDVEKKRQKVLEGGAAVDSVMVCSVCNVVCNSLVAFSDHISGKKHATQAGAIPTNTMLPAHLVPSFSTTPMVQPPANTVKKMVQKKPKIVQSMWCEICNTECNTKDVLDKHKLGKKHQKKLEKLQESKKIPTVPASTLSQLANNPVIGPQEKPSSNNTDSNRGSKKKLVSAPKEDVETKRRKIMSGGAAAEAVRICNICNVVCNSQTVFVSHLAGTKHANLVKKQAEAAGTSALGNITLWPVGMWNSELFHNGAQQEGAKRVSVKIVSAVRDFTNFEILVYGQSGLSQKQS